MNRWIVKQNEFVPGACVATVIVAVNLWCQLVRDSFSRALSLQAWPFEDKRLIYLSDRVTTCLVMDSTISNEITLTGPVTCAAVVNGIRLAWMCGAVPEISEPVSRCVNNEQPASVWRLRTCLVLSDGPRVRCVLCAGRLLEQWTHNSVKCCILVLHHRKKFQLSKSVFLFV